MTHDERLKIIGAMAAHGGSFVKALASAWLHADEDNARRIERAFPEFVERYRKIARELDREVA